MIESLGDELAEFDQLNARITTLQAFLLGDGVAALSHEDRMMLSGQHQHMRGYAHLLGKRLGIEPEQPGQVVTDPAKPVAGNEGAENEAMPSSGNATPQTE